ncbi:MAG: N-acetylmuramoyl-L-alanine amidase, partial [Bacteroidales bacterium]
ESFDPNSPDAYIIFSLFQNAHLDQSLTFASKLQTHYQKNIPSVNRGVKQAGFLVLYRSTMPAILTEIGFINNPEEEKYMNSEEGQAQIVKSLFNAFKEYKYQVEGFNNQTDSKNGKDDNDTPIVENTDQTPTKPTSNSQATAKPIYEKPHTANKNKTNIIFKIQFASSSIDKPLNALEFSKLTELSKIQQNGIYKYFSGKESTLEGAQALLKSIQENGFTDAFIVVYKNGERISTADAIRILKEQNK